MGSDVIFNADKMVDLVDHTAYRRRIFEGTRGVHSFETKPGQGGALIMFAANRAAGLGYRNGLFIGISHHAFLLAFC
jgi:hypothetical protein